jgi:signal transduction histidine kinase
MMRTFSDREHALIDRMESTAERALKERPSFTIRSRISLGFILWFILSLGITAASFIILTKIEHKLEFMEAAGNYIFEIQQARRFEKNYFLYGTNLDDSVEHVRQARSILATNGENISRVVGPEVFKTMADHIERYEKLLSDIRRGGNEISRAGAYFKEIEDELRIHGAEMVTAAERLLEKERRSVHKMIFMSKRVPMFFLIFLLLLMIYLANFITMQILRPLKNLMDATRRIAEGDVTTPIRPTRRYRDELTELSVAMNRMMHQLSRRQEQLIVAHKLKAIGTLTAGIAHELNNPVNNIMLTASMLQEDYSTLAADERLEMINDLVEQAERSRRIVRNLLDFARENEIHPSLVQPEALIQETLQLVGNQLKLSKVKVDFCIPENLPPVYGDKQQLRQVFLNLILNAIDAMSQGGTLSILLYKTDGDNDLKIDFKDTGCGIPEHVLPNIFDPFFTTKATSRGTGLGLSVSLGIARKHGGDIRVTSRVNEGSTFSILLPQAKVPASLPEERKSSEDGGRWAVDCNLHETSI